MKMRKKEFTLLELLAVIAIISVLALAFASALGSSTDKARSQQAEVAIRSVETALEMFVTTYGEVPEDLRDLLEENNPRKITFYKGNELPVDPFSTGLGVEGAIKIIKGVSSVTKNKHGDITGGALGGTGMVIYSVGPNGKADPAGSLSGGVNDLQDGGEKDDISVFVSF